MRARVVVVKADVSAIGGVVYALHAHGFLVCGTARSSEEALALARRERPHIALLDLDLLGGRGEDLVAELRCTLPRVSPVVLTTLEDPARVLAAAAAGVAGYLLAPLGAEELASALRHVLAGDAPVSSRPAKVMLDELVRRGIPDRSWKSLSHREQSVLAGVARGLTQSQIAAELGIAVGTVQTYIGRTVEKLEVSNRDEAVRRATELHLIGAEGADGSALVA